MAVQAPYRVVRFCGISRPLVALGWRSFGHGLPGCSTSKAAENAGSDSREDVDSAFAEAFSKLLKDDMPARSTASPVATDSSWSTARKLSSKELAIGSVPQASGSQSMDPLPTHTTPSYTSASTCGLPSPQQAGTNSQAPQTVVGTAPPAIARAQGEHASPHTSHPNTHSTAHLVRPGFTRKKWRNQAVKQAFGFTKAEPESGPPASAPARASTGTPVEHTLYSGSAHAQWSPQHTPAQHTLAQHVPAQYTPAQHAPAQHVSAQHAPAQHAPAQHAPAQYTPAQHAPAQHAPVRHAPAQHMYQPSLGNAVSQAEYYSVQQAPSQHAHATGWPQPLTHPQSTHQQSTQHPQSTHQQSTQHPQSTQQQKVERSRKHPVPKKAPFAAFLQSPKNITEEGIRKLFANCPPISIKIYSPRCKFVLFETRQHLLDALSGNGTAVPGRGGDCEPVGLFVTDRFAKIARESHSPPHTAYLTYVPVHATPESVAKLFAHLQPVEESCRVVHRDNGRGYGFISFHDRDSLLRAFDLHSTDAVANMSVSPRR